MRAPGTRSDRGAGGHQSRARAAGQRGFTLVELMIAMMIGSLLIGLVFAIYTRMSVAYRTQSVLSDTQQTLRTARETIVADVRQAGFMLPNGFRLAADGPFTKYDPAVPSGDLPHFAIEVVNDVTNADGPDLIRVFYADPSARARVSAVAPLPEITSATVDDIDEFAVGDLAVITAPKTPTRSPTDGTDIAEYAIACVVRVTGTGPGTLSFDGSDANFNSATNDHCEDILEAGSLRPGTMVYRFVARAYRIIPSVTDPGLSILQRSPTGGVDTLPDDWQDLAFGFTDLQIASRYFEKDDAVDVDGDGDPQRDWYSGDIQEPQELGTATRPSQGVLMQVTVSLVARTLRTVDAAATTEQPAFIDEALPEHNELGDKPSVSTTGDHLYRYSTNRVDVRNMGVGR